MQCFIQIDKKSKRVRGYSSNPSENEYMDEFLVNDKNFEAYKEVLENPYSYIFDDNFKKFIVDEEYKKELLERQNRNIKDEKYNTVMQLLTQARLDSIKKDNLLNILLKERALNRLQNIKKEGNNNA